MIPAERAHLYVAATSHPGLSGKENEDRYSVSAYYTDAPGGTPSLLAVVADGVGGHRAGEVAAELAVETISRYVAESDASQPLPTLQQAIVHASHVIAEKSASSPELSGMGSTVACAWIIGAQLYTASVGDTRIYLLRDGVIRQLTIDHTWVQEAIEYGALKPEEARSHPNAHVIRRFLGSRQDVVPDVRLRLHPEESDARAVANQGLLLKPGDMLLLCSDGLTDLVDDDEILACLETQNVTRALDDLVRLANRRGGHDNITLIALRMPILDQPTIPIVRRRRHNRLTAVGIALGALLFIALIAFGALAWSFQRGALQPSPTPTLSAGKATLAIVGVTPQLQATASSPPEALRSSQEPATTAAAVSTPLQATLTPWPTNTPP